MIKIFSIDAIRKRDTPFKMIIPMQVKSGNMYTQQMGKGSYFIYPNYRDKWYARLGASAPTMKSNWNKKQFMNGAIYRLMEKGKREFDGPNFEHGCKPIPDWLKKNGWIFDDSPSWWWCDYQQVKKQQWEKLGAKAGTLIALWPNTTGVQP